MPKSNKRNSEQKSAKYPTNIAAWDKDEFISGVFKVTREFLLELLERYDEGDEEVVDSYDDGYAVIYFTLNESDYESVDFIGSGKIGTGKSKKKSTVKKRKSASRGDYVDDFDEEDDEETEVAHSSRRAKSSTRSSRYRR